MADFIDEPQITIHLWKLTFTIEKRITNCNTSLPSEYQSIYANYTEFWLSGLKNSSKIVWMANSSTKLFIAKK